MKIKFYPVEEKRNPKLKYAIIGARLLFKDWIFVRHKERDTWELPAGHIEPNEKPSEAAKRELYEETGAVCYTILPLFDYSVKIGMDKRYGRVYFAELEDIGDLPDFEIAEVSFHKKLPKKLTYPEIQTEIFQKILDRINKKAL